MPVERTAGEGKERVQLRGRRKKSKRSEKKNLAQYDVSVNIVSLPRREDR